MLLWLHPKDWHQNYWMASFAGTDLVFFSMIFCVRDCNYEFIPTLIYSKQLFGFYQTFRPAVMTCDPRYSHYYCLSTETVFSVVWIGVTIPLLMVASKNSRPGLILPWLIFNAVTILIILNGFAFFLSNYLMNLHSFDRTTVGIGIAFVALFLLGSGA